MKTVAEQVAAIRARAWAGKLYQEPRHHHQTVSVDAETGHWLMRRGHLPMRIRRDGMVFADTLGTIARLLETRP